MHILHPISSDPSLAQNTKSKITLLTIHAYCTGCTALTMALLAPLQFHHFSYTSVHSTLHVPSPSQTCTHSLHTSHNTELHKSPAHTHLTVFTHYLHITRTLPSLHINSQTHHSHCTSTHHTNYHNHKTHTFIYAHWCVWIWFVDRVKWHGRAVRPATQQCQKYVEVRPPDIPLMLKLV